MSILRFKQFESYLKSGRYLLYHTINTGAFVKMIMDNDEIKPGMVSRGPAGICFSRSANWTNELSNSYRFVLDTDLLIRDGYRPVPLQELMYNVRSNGKANVTQNVWKGRLDWYKNSKRTTPHGVDTLPSHDKSIMETEFEERILENITNVGKYIVYIDFVEPPTGDLLNSLVKYVTKYPHISARIMNKTHSHKVKEFIPTLTAIGAVTPLIYK